MKNLLAVLLVSFTIGLCGAQEVTTEYSAYFNKESEKDIYTIVFPDAYGFMTLHHLDNVMMDNTKAMVLTKHDQSMQAIESKTFNLPKLGLRASDLREVIELEDQLVFLSSVMDKKKRKHQVNAQVYSQKENSVSEHKVIASFSIDSYSKSGFYQIAISPDQTKIAIVANMPYVKKTKEKVKVWVYDNQLNLLWEQNKTLTYSSKRSYQEAVFVQNSGTVVMSKTTDAFKKTRKSTLLTFNQNLVDTHAFSSAGFMPMEMELIDVRGVPMLSGFFWSGGKTVIKINSKEGEENDGAFLYDLNTNTLIGSHKWDNSSHSNDLKSLQVVDVKVIGDDIFMIGEKQLQDSEFRKNGATITTDLDYFYTYGSSVIVNLDIKGTLKSFTPLFNSKQYKNAGKQDGSLSALFLENGLRVFSNNRGSSSVDSFFTTNELSFNNARIIPFENGQTRTSYLVPHTVKAVDNYAMVYYLSHNGARYWFNKMTW